VLGAAFAAGRYRDVASHSSFESAGRELNSPSLTQQARNTWLWVDGRSQRRATNSQNLRTPRKFWHRSVFSVQFSVARLWRQRFLECGDLSELSSFFRRSISWSSLDVCRRHYRNVHVISRIGPIQSYSIVSGDTPHPGRSHPLVMAEWRAQ
jgi:DNA segregation ATPase FtsK/SpoIIIE-like protein